MLILWLIVYGSFVDFVFIVKYGWNWGKIGKYVRYFVYIWFI